MPQRGHLLFRSYIPQGRTPNPGDMCVLATPRPHLTERYGLFYPFPVRPGKISVVQETDRFNNPAEVCQGRLARSGNLVRARGGDSEGMCSGSLGELTAHGLDVARNQLGVVPLFADGTRPSLGCPLEHQLSE